MIRVVKVGGSLLDLPDLGQRLAHWLDQQPLAANVLIVGGGTAVDMLRREFAEGLLDDHDAHWRAIEMIDHNARMMASHLGWASVSNTLAEIETQRQTAPIFFAPHKWLREQEPHLPGTRLPESWDVTCDSIAGRLAVTIHAAELVLLKSAPPPSADLTELARLGYIDNFLPQLQTELPLLQLVDLRSICA